MADDKTATLVDRLRGIYRIPIWDGLGAVGAGEEPDNPDEFVRKFETPPIQHEAAAEIERLRNALAADRALSVLRSVEWSGETDMEEGGHEAACPCCDGPRRLGHEPDCQLAGVLTEIKEH